MKIGGIISISIFTIPALLLKPHQRSKAVDHEAILGASPSHVARQWLNTFDLGKLVFPSLALTSGLLYSYVAFAVHGEQNGRYLSTLYAVAAGLTVFIGPFTGFSVLPVNEKIMPFTKKTDDLSGNENAEVRRERDEHELVGYLKKWSQLNLIRGIFPLLGAGLGAAVSFGLV